MSIEYIHVSTHRLDPPVQSFDRGSYAYGAFPVPGLAPSKPLHPAASIKSVFFPRKLPGSLSRAPLKGLGLIFRSFRVDLYKNYVMSLKLSGLFVSVLVMRSIFQDPPTTLQMNPKYHLIETIWPLLEVHWGVHIRAPKCRECSPKHHDDS